MKAFLYASLTALVGVSFISLAADNSWKPAAGPLMTRWARDVSPKNAHPEYPRPQMVRKDWQNLNGLWDYVIAAKDAAPPTQWDGQILVPFPIESALSGVMKRVYETNRLWCRRTFEVPKAWKGKNVLLHFGAVDWEATVWVNGKELGAHRGGYDGFSFDITDALRPKGEQEIVVAVRDPADAGSQPRGKQVRNPHGIWYTPTSGIWQTVWLEPVSALHVRSLDFIPDVDNGQLRVTVGHSAADGRMTISADVFDSGRSLKASRVEIGDTYPRSHAQSSDTFSIPIKNAALWSPESPKLYDLKITVSLDGKKTDEVTGYFAMRKISLGKDDAGRLRMCLNNKPYFMLGPLDQGFWPDGLYTAPTDEALRYDIEMTKKLGFNMARKHVKVEPDRWYYWCDKLGLLVWQDMPSGDKSAPWHGPSGVEGKEMERAPESVAIYEHELKALIAGRGNHPCIVVWVPFNEGWGQFDTVRILNLAKQLDPTRLVDGASGGNHFPAGDIIDHHQYPGPGLPPKVTDRAMVLGEFGGLGLPLKGHTWQDEKNWGYKSFTNAEALTTAYVGLVEQLPAMEKNDGLSAAVYTQTTDVEIEINGLMSYDRAVVKMDAEKIAKANKAVWSAPQSRDGGKPSK